MGAVGRPELVERPSYCSALVPHRRLRLEEESGAQEGLYRAESTEHQASSIECRYEHHLLQEKAGTSSKLFSKCKGPLFPPWARPKHDCMHACKQPQMCLGREVGGKSLRSHCSRNKSKRSRVPPFFTRPFLQVYPHEMGSHVPH